MRCWSTASLSYIPKARTTSNGTGTASASAYPSARTQRTLAASTTALSYFTDSCHKLNLEDVGRKDLLKFCAFLRDEKEQAPRSVYNKFENLMSFLKAQGIRGLVGKNDWPRYTEEEPEIYEQEELDKLFAACDAEERLWYRFNF
jgi:hypothetical protein